MDEGEDGIVMNDEEFNKNLEKILKVIYEVENNPKKESAIQQIRYRNYQPTSNRKYRP